MATYPHVEWLDLYSDGTLHECAVVKKDNIGNIYFFRIRDLDVVDRRRIAKILTGRNANNFALWDLMFQTTLGNGMNALDYFHQYVKVKTPRGQIITPSHGTIGGAAARQTGVMQAPQAPQDPQQSSEPAPAPAPTPKAPKGRVTPPAE